MKTISKATVISFIKWLKSSCEITPYQATLHWKYKGVFYSDVQIFDYWVNNEYKL